MIETPISDRFDDRDAIALFDTFAAALKRGEPFAVILQTPTHAPAPPA